MVKEEIFEGEDVNVEKVNIEIKKEEPTQDVDENEGVKEELEKLKKKLNLKRKENLYQKKERLN